MRKTFARIRNTLPAGLIIVLTMKKIARKDVSRQMSLTPRSVGTSKRGLMPIIIGDIGTMRAEYAA
jgi:hypothetical protein